MMPASFDRGGWYRSGLIRSIASGILLGAAFPPSPVSSLAFVAFIPWLTVFDRERKFGAAARQAYAFLAVFHASTVYWTGGFTHAHDPWMMTAGLALLFVHPLFLLPFLMAAWGVRRRLGRGFGLAAFALFWTTFEYFHARGEFSFPWMSLANSQAFDHARIQMAEFTSTAGLTLHVLTFNVLAFLVLLETAEGHWPRRRWVTVVLATSMAIIYVGPIVWGTLRIRSVDMTGTGAPVRVGIVQPDIDPWEKWGKDEATKWRSYERQLSILDSMTRSLAVERPDVVVWPETAVPYFVLQPGFRPSLDRLRSLTSMSGATLLTGFPHVEYFPAAHAPVTARPVPGTDEMYEAYNAITTISPTGNVGPVYEKVILVPFAERLPYAEELRFLIEPLRWNVGISSWGKGHDTTVFRVPVRAGDSCNVAAMICYESAYPDFVRSFSQRGAQILLIITNDSWWGRTSGAYQHAAMARLRAVENRRWVVQCANGGVSEVVDPSGSVVRHSKLYESAAWTAEVYPLMTPTFFEQHGDAAGLTAVAASVIVGVLGLFLPRRAGQARDGAEHDRSSQ